MKILLSFVLPALLKQKVNKTIKRENFKLFSNHLSKAFLTFPLSLSLYYKFHNYFAITRHEKCQNIAPHFNNNVVLSFRNCANAFVTCQSFFLLYVMGNCKIVEATQSAFNDFYLLHIILNIFNVSPCSLLFNSFWTQRNNMDNNELYSEIRPFWATQCSFILLRMHFVTKTVQACTWWALIHLKSFFFNIRLNTISNIADCYYGMNKKKQDSSLSCEF